ncbi:uncharacterized protein LOC124743691 [Schistocerca piceifrons]|uniref:uncharacterized protein LOC124743691 n=1 Tax=Schistocerca piceifrons TaxID=274613 RepID=UPI001F5F8BCB|nr:uncharacterized protein LOC124743691 [Schistocerca piceifrons]
MAPQLLVAADQYGLSVLKVQCEQQVAAQLSVETASATGVLAIRHSANMLKQAAVAFIKAHLLSVMATQGWDEAVVNDPQTFMELVHLIAETLTNTSTPGAGESRTGPPSQPHSGHSDDGRSPATAVPPTTPQATPQPDDAAVYHQRNVSGDMKGEMLIAAAKEGSVSKVRTLMAVGADVEAKDENKRTALHWASAMGHGEVAAHLLEVEQALTPGTAGRTRLSIWLHGKAMQLWCGCWQLPLPTTTPGIKVEARHCTMQHGVAAQRRRLHC